MKLHANWLDRSVVFESLRQNDYYLKEVASDRPVAELLVGYVQSYERLINKSQIEWRLAERVLGESFSGQAGWRLPNQFALPDEILSRYSGSMLQWVLNQRLRQGVGLPGRLNARSPLTSQQAILFARAWALWPQNPVLLGKGCQVELSCWLKRSRKALGWVTIALAGGENLALAKESAQLWLVGALDDPYIIFLLQSLLHYPEMRKEGRQALRRVIMRYRNDEKIIEQLCQLAFKRESYQEVIDAAELLLPKITDEPGYQKIDAMRIAALARIQGHEEAAINGYRQRWSHTKAKFPYPHLLLPTMNSPESESLRKHLLNYCELSDDVPSWVRLEQLDMQGRWQESLLEWGRILSETIQTYLPAPKELAGRESSSSWHKILPQWSKLVENQAQIRHFFFRLTETVINAQPSRPEPYYRITQTLWKTIVGENGQPPTSHRGLLQVAQSALVLLEPSVENRIERYQIHLYDTPLSLHLLITRAARAYIKALVSRKRWSKLLEFSEHKNIGGLRQVCTIEEYHFFQRMIEVEKKKHIGEEWCYIWEELMSLPLQDDQVQAAIEHFVEIRQQLHHRQYSILLSDRFVDVELQLKRRGQAIGERLLRSAQISKTDHDQLRKDLANATLDGLSQVLSAIKVRSSRKA